MNSQEKKLKRIIERLIDKYHDYLWQRNRGHFQRFRFIKSELRRIGLDQLPKVDELIWRCLSEDQFRQINLYYQTRERERQEAQEIVERAHREEERERERIEKEEREKEERERIEKEQKPSRFKHYHPIHLAPKDAEDSQKDEK